MKLVMTLQIGDDCTWHAEVVMPLEFESKDKLLYVLMEKTLESIENKKYEFEFLGKTFSAKNFGFDWDSQSVKFIDPEIETLEDWFIKNQMK